MTFPAPFKVCIPSRGRARIGVAACSYEHLREVLRKKYDVCGDFCLQQDDGTLVCDEDYFKLLEPNTLLTVVESENMRHLTSGEGISPGIKRPMQAQPDAVSAVQRKRPHLEAPQTHSLNYVPRRTPPHPSRQGQCITSPISGIIPLPRTDAMHIPSGLRQPSSGSGSASLASQLQITNVVGNVSMSPSPPRQVQRAPPPAPLNALPHQTLPKLTPMNVMYRVPVPHLPAPLRCHPQTLSVGVPQYHCPPTYVHGPSPHYPPSNHPLYPSALNSPPYLPGPSHPSHISEVSLTRVPNLAPHLQTTRFSSAHHLPSAITAPNPPSTTSLSALQPPQPSSPCPIATSLSHSPHPSIPHPLPTSLTPPLNLLSHPTVRLAPIPSTTSLPSAPNPPSHPGPSATTLPPPPNPPPHPPSSQQDQTKTLNSLLDKEFTVQAKTLPLLSQIPTSTPTSETSPVGSTSTTQPPVSDTTSTVEPSPLPSPNFTLHLPPSPTDAEPPKLSTVEVVSCPNDAASLPDSDEDEDKLCIIEQVYPSTENASHHQKSFAKKRQKPSALPITAPSTQSLGDAKYPIIIDEDDTATKAVDLNFSDEGYSSSSSPYDTLCDFTSALPFASYEAENKTSQGLLDTFTDKGPEVVEETENDTVVEEDPNTQMGTFQATECVSEDVDEEDFDMDVDVFSPLPSPTLAKVAQPRPWQLQPPLPDYLPLEVDSERDPPCDENQLVATTGSSEGSSDEKMFVVSIPRESLTDPLYKKRRCHSLTDNLYVPPAHTSPRPRRREYVRRLSRLSVSSDTKQKLGRKHKKRKWKRRHNSVPVSSYRFPRPEHLMVHIPIHRGKDGDILCGECSDDSDVPTTAMELLAARLDETKGARRLPQIIRLESSFPREELEDIHCKRVAESVVEVADYCSEMNIMSVCSAEDLTECLRDLASLWSDSEGSGGTPLDIGDEIELSGPSQNCAEMTGMELLNLQRSDKKSLHPQPLEQPEATWSVYSLDSRGYLSDPRLRVQKYFLGDKAAFVLSCTNGIWQLHEP